MSSVAVPAAASGPAFRTEADLARSAARSDRDAFEELFRRHSQTSWRLAVAVSPDRTQAGDAVAEGFSQVLRGVRRRRISAETPFRPVLLAEVYRAAMNQVRADHAAKDAPSPGGTEVATGTAELGAADAATAAFKSLPERWRAAMWLAEVEHLEIPALATIVGVSAPVASQLVDRGRQGLLARFAQAGVAVPDHLGEVLRPLAATVPANLDAVAVKRWKSAVAVDPAGRLAPLAAWLTEWAPRPLWIASGGLVALGMIGLGVLTVSSAPTPTGPAAAIQAPPPSGGAPVNPTPRGPGNPGPGGPGNLLFGPGGGASGLFSGAGTFSATGIGSDGVLNTGEPSSTNPILAGEGTTAQPGAATTGGGSGTPSPSGASGSTGAPGSANTGGGSPPTTPGGTTPTTPATTTPTTPATTIAPPATAKTLINVPNIASVSQPASGGVAATVGSSSAPILGVTISPTCTGLQVLDLITNKCVATPATTAPSTTAPSLLGGLLSGLGL